MPYTTERGVMSYADRDTPREYATSEDEDRASYNEARDEAFRAVEHLYELVEKLYEPPNVPHPHFDMRVMAGSIQKLVEDAECLLAGGKTGRSR